MGGIFEIDGVKPVVGSGTYIHPDATLIGDVIIGSDCYIGPNASLRGDFGQIYVGNGSNVQDHCMLHSFPNRECRVEELGHVSHGAILHGCLIKKYGFVGIQAVVMDGAVVGEHAMVGAMAFVKADFDVTDGSLAVGSPAKVVRDLSDMEKQWKARGLVSYQDLARRSLATLRECEPLSELEENRPSLMSDPENSVALNELKAQDKP